MTKNRLILTLLLKNSILVNSRKFNLNNISDIPTMLTYLNFDAIDELIILNINTDKKDKKVFYENIRQITKECFLPVCIGGGINSLNDCYEALNNGADKIILNSIVNNDMCLLKLISNTFGKQFLVISIDVKKYNNIYKIYINNGAQEINIDFITYIKLIEQNGAGEILLRSIDNDGSGEGYDIELLKLAKSHINIPIVIAGGMGEFNHLSEAIHNGANAVNVGNLFHFIGEGLIKAKNYLKSNGLNFANSQWNFSVKKEKDSL